MSPAEPGQPATSAAASPQPSGNRLRDRIEALVDAIGRATSWLVLAIVALMAGNVLLRYLFRTGSVWSQELEWHLLAPLILFGMSYALRHGEHVRVDIVYGRLSQRGKAAVDGVAALLTTAVALAVVWLSLAYVRQSWEIGETSSDPGGLTHRWALKALIPTGFTLLALQASAQVLDAVERLRGARR